MQAHHGHEMEEEFSSKTEAQITLSFDHRSIDGGGAGRLLKRVIRAARRPEETVAPFLVGRIRDRLFNQGAFLLSHHYAIASETGRA